jgi:hypothetical protein
VLEVLGLAEEDELALLLDDLVVELEDVEVELGMTERSRNCEILLAWASLTMAWQGVGDGVVEAVTGQVCKPFVTEYVSTVVKLATPAALGHVDVKVGTSPSASLAMSNMKELLLTGFEKDVSTKLSYATHVGPRLSPHWKVHSPGNSAWLELIIKRGLSE